MITLYRKTNKSIDNLSGYEEIKEEENPFTKPCLLCISAQTHVDKSVFGLAKVGASLARVRVRNHYNGGFDRSDENSCHTFLEGIGADDTYSCVGEDIMFKGWRVIGIFNVNGKNRVKIVRNESIAIQK